MYMPSKAFGVFNRNVKQVDKLIDAYNSLKTPQRGRKYLDHLTRSALVFLCSSWEVYLEQITVECCEIIARRLNSPKDLPEQVRKSISSAIKNAKHDLEPVTFAMDWKKYYCDYAKKYIEKLNTPKKGQVLEIFEKYLGANIPQFKLDVPTLDKINDIVSLRGEIAHNIFAEEYLKVETVIADKDTIMRLVKEIEIFLWGYLPGITNGKRPWQNTYR